MSARQPVMSNGKQPGPIQKKMMKSVHLRKLLELVKHDDEDNSGDSHQVYCEESKMQHKNLDDIMPDMSDLIAEGVAMPGEGPLDLGGGVTFEHIERTAFTDLRHIFGLDEQNYTKSVENMNGGATEPSGKSGSLFWFSPDKSILMKSITEREVDKIVEILDDYRNHFINAKAEKRLVLLSRFYGLYRFSVGKDSVCLVAMNNVFGNQKPSRIYDIKGTTEDRYVDPAPGKVMKDLNYKDLQVGLKETDVQALLEAVDADSALLEAQNIMDYSILLGVHENPSEVSTHGTGSKVYQGVELDEEEGTEAPRDFQIGIIDMLVDYSGKKIAAHWLKKLTIGFCQEIDTEPPGYYQQRFYNNAEHMIVNNA